MEKSATQTLVQTLTPLQWSSLGCFMLAKLATIFAAITLFASMANVFLLSLSKLLVGASILLLFASIILALQSARQQQDTEEAAHAVDNP